MIYNPLYAELDRLRTEIAANERVAARLEEQRAKAEERVREMEASCAVMRRALEAVSQELCEWPMPEPAHEGPCGPETLCDGDCMSRYHVFRHNQVVRQVKDVLTIKEAQDATD